MAATKRKRRGGLAVQAKRPKRSEKDARPPAKQRDKAEDAEGEDRDRIPGPVCKVEGLRPGFTCGRGFLRLPWSHLSNDGSAAFRVARVSQEPAFSSRPDWSPRLQRTLGTWLPPGGAAEQLRGLGALTWLTGNPRAEYSVPALCFLAPTPAFTFFLAGEYTP